MPTPIELTLSSLLPTVSFLPPELIALSTSLLAQSRSKAASLKPEEEIGRTYACCHIACQRLGHKLALEIAKPAPPVKPRVYNKLHTYLNSVLKTTATPRTPNAKRTEYKLQYETPKKRINGNANAQAAAVTVATPAAKSNASATPGKDQEVTVYIMPLIRHICKTFEVPEAAPHVYAGVSSVLRVTTTERPETPPSKRRKITSEDDLNGRLHVGMVPALILTLFIAVYGKMYGSDLAEDPEFCLKAVEITREYCEKNQKSDGYQHKEDEDMSEYIKDFNERALDEWLNMEWYENVPSVEAEAGAEDDKEEDIADEPLTPRKRPAAKTPLRRKEKHGNIEDDDMGAAGLLPGLGTMFQPAIDWLSDERRAEYAQWKKQILREAAAKA